MYMFPDGVVNQIQEKDMATGTTKGMPVTADAIKPVTDASGSDFYFFVLKKDAASQLYGTFFGQQDPVLEAILKLLEIMLMVVQAALIKMVLFTRLCVQIAAAL